MPAAKDKVSLEAQRFALNPMDQVMPRFYANFILTIGLKPNIPFSQVHSLLQASLATAADELPIFRRRVFSVPVDDPVRNPTANPGLLEAREHPDWTPRAIFNDLSASWPEYDDLLDEGLPEDVLDGDQLVPPAVHAKPDLEVEGAVGCIVQANYLEGGLLLTVCLFHTLVDGMSGSLLLKMLAKHMRLHQNDEEEGTGAASLSIPPECWDYSLVPRAWEEAGNKLPSKEEYAKALRDDDDDDSWRLLGMLPPWTPELKERDEFSLDPTVAKTFPEMKTTIFYISAAAFTRLTALATEPDSSSHDGDAPVSPTANDAVMALLWRCLMRARQTADPTDPAYSSPGAIAELDTTLDGRLLFSPTKPLPWAYMGTLIFIATTCLPMATLTAPSTTTPLRTIARAVRRAIAAITPQRLHRSYGLAASVADYTLARFPFATFDGAELCFTSFLGLPLMELRFGGKVFRKGGLVDHLRPPRREFDVVCRRCVVLPPRPAGGFEVLVSLKTGEMEALERDEEFGAFAKVLCH